MHDLSAFVIQDYLGGSFFHLLLSPLVAAFAGMLGGFLGKGLRWLQASYRTEDHRREGMPTPLQRKR